MDDEIMFCKISENLDEPPSSTEPNDFKSLRSTVPVSFDGLFGWLTPGTGLRGVILCATYGFEQIRAHRPWRDLAEQIAGTNCAVLRFDYPGEGDSADLASVRLSTFVSAIRRAIRFLREEGGVEAVDLIGLRFGATLATLAAQEGGVDRLVLLAPFATGQAYLREMTIQSRLIDRLSDGTPRPRGSGGLSVGGFALSPELVADLSTINLVEIGRPPVRHILLLGTNQNDLATRYGAGGALATAPFPDLARLVSTSDIPRDAFSAIVDFLADGMDADSGGAKMRPVGENEAGRDIEAEIQSGQSQNTFQAHHDLAQPSIPAQRIAGSGWSEEPTHFGSGLFGILCRPSTASIGGPALLFLNAGTDVRSGYGRQTTNLARRLAQVGVSSLRFDLRGIGDSVSRSDGTSPLYADDALDDVLAALDELESQIGGSVGVVGICSGAYLAFQAICRDPRIDAALLINLYCFDWDPAEDVEVALRDMVRNVSSYSKLLRQPKVWKRALRGEVRIATILSGLMRQSFRRLTTWCSRSSASVAQGESAAERLDAVHRRGGRVRFVFSAGEPGLDRVRAELGRAQRRFARQFVILEGADHNLTTEHAEVELRDLLLDFGNGLTKRAPRDAAGR